MDQHKLTAAQIKDFSVYLRQEEKSIATQEKYLRDVWAFFQYSNGDSITKNVVIEWKQYLLERGYGVRSINSMLASVNSLLEYLGMGNCRVRSIRTQRQTYCAEDRELTKKEYMRLLETTRGNERLNLILQTICSTGIRVSELRYFTVEAVRLGRISVNCKSKTRTIFVPGKLKKLLLNYSKRNGILSGTIFLGKTGKAMDRSSIWRQMKRLCRRAGVKESKVFPHNLRKLFARTFYSIDKDMAKLADILGHSSINTTRIYIMTTGQEHRRKMERLNLII